MPDCVRSTETDHEISLLLLERSKLLLCLVPSDRVQLHFAVRIRHHERQLDLVQRIVVDLGPQPLYVVVYEMKSKRKR